VEVNLTWALLEFSHSVAITYFPCAFFDLHDWTSHFLSVDNLSARCVDRDKGTGKCFPNKSWRLRQGMECWLLSIVWHSAQLEQQRCKLLALSSLYPPGNTLAVISVRDWMDPKGSWMRTEEFGHWIFFQGLLKNCPIPTPWILIRFLYYNGHSWSFSLHYL